MKNIGKTILKAIFNNLWCKIKYNNLDKQETSFMIAVKKIICSNKLLVCDAFNVAYGYKQMEVRVYFEQITEIMIVEDTYYNYPQSLVDDINENPNKYSFLHDSLNKEDIIDYYIDCFKLDTTPYLTKYTLVPGIDDDVIMKNNEYSLTNEQFKKLADNVFYKKKSKDKNNNYEEFLVMNLISILDKKGLYVLVYRPLLLDITEHKLIPSDVCVVNTEFAFDENNIEEKESIYKYIPEEERYLLDDFETNRNKILEVLHEYNKTGNSSYRQEIKVDSRPYLLTLGRKFTIDVEAELIEIKKQLTENYDDMPLPLKSFFGENAKLARRVNYPIFTTDNKYNIDQINAIHEGFSSVVSYIQGPPGTGKTQTLLNAILSAEFNGKTVLVTSNNNIPMDGIYADILDLKYNDERLLFPAIRLGNKSYLLDAIKRIKAMYNRALELKPRESLIKQIKERRKQEMKGLLAYLERYDKYKLLQERKQGLIKLKESSQGSMLVITIDTQLNSIENELKTLGNFNEEEFNKYMHIDYKSLFMAIHYETASKLQSLSKPRYSELYAIINANISNEQERQEQLKMFKRYLSEPTKLALFQEIFPVIISTNLSTNYLGQVGNMFDFVMMDEAGQCNIVNALIPLARAKQLILVGDPQQLQPVILLDKLTNKKLKNKYKIPLEYDYVEKSIYTALTEIDAKGYETLLRYHYRSNEKIIGFSNQKYYHGKLIPKCDRPSPTPLEYIDTSNVDNENVNNVKNTSIAEAREICNYINNHKDERIAVITPFVHQKECVETYLKANGLKAIVGTVHSFQGEQADTVIFSTAITKNTAPGTYNWFKNNKELINVAVTRAKDKLLVLGNNEKIKVLSDGTDDLYELVRYVNTNGVSKVTDVSPPSLALGTRQMSTESEKELSKTVTHILSVLNNNCFIRNEVPISSIFQNNGREDSLYFNGKFDIVIFEHGLANKEYLKLAIELNGPEHYSSEEVINRDNIKKEICKKHNLDLISIRRDLARDYYPIKAALEKIIKVVNKKD